MSNLIEALGRDLKATKQGEAPRLDLRTLIHETGLATSEIDGDLLFHRLAGKTNPLNVVPRIFSVLRLQAHVRRLSDDVFTRVSTSAQDVLAVRLTGLACAQVIREGDTCEFADEMTRNFAINRSDLMPHLSEELLAETDIEYLTPDIIGWQMRRMALEAITYRILDLGEGSSVLRRRGIRR